MTITKKKKICHTSAILTRSVIGFISSVKIKQSESLFESVLLMLFQIIKIILLTKMQTSELVSYGITMITILIMILRIKSTMKNCVMTKISKLKKMLIVFLMPSKSIIYLIIIDKFSRI